MAVFRGTRGEIHGVLRVTVGRAFATGFGDGSGCCYKALIALAEKQPSFPYGGISRKGLAKRYFLLEGRFRAEERRKGGALRAGLHAKGQRKQRRKGFRAEGRRKGDVDFRF
jgi:hypothetical protein